MIDQPERAIDQLAELAHAGARAGDDPARALEGRMRLLLQAGAEAQRERTTRPVWRWAAAACVLASVVGLWFVWPRALSYEVSGNSGEGPYLSAPANAPVTVRFSDQTSLRAEAGSRLRIEDVTARGARVLVEHGRAHVKVEHKTHASWTFAAGPFEVLVTGTRFQLDWDPGAGRIELVMHEGSVLINGPLASGPIALRAGQAFRGDVPGRSMTVVEAPATAPTPASAPPAAPTPAAPATAEPAPEPVEAPAATAAVEPPAAPVGKAAPPREAWSKLVAKGRFAAVIAEAEERGIPACYASCSAAELRSLSDAARYTGRADVAEQSLLALRKRFAGGAEGRAAAFTLGRLHEWRGSPAAAKTWYETYLSEAPGGKLAAEALAGKMRVVLASQGRKAAQPIAREYLSRYPEGVHAKTARDIAEAY